MNNFMVLTESINFIEDNLCEPITREDIAAHCYVSLSKLEKLFRYALHISIKDYISRRRMTQAAKDIKADAGIDIGFTLIGMHLKEVAVPLRLKNNRIGEAMVLAARTRPKFIGGVRAAYDEKLL